MQTRLARLNKVHSNTEILKDLNKAKPDILKQLMRLKARYLKANLKAGNHEYGNEFA